MQRPPDLCQFPDPNEYRQIQGRFARSDRCKDVWSIRQNGSLNSETERGPTVEMWGKSI